MHTKPCLGNQHESAFLKQIKRGMVNEGECCKEFIEKLTIKFKHAGGVLQSTGTHALALAIHTLAKTFGCRHPQVLISDYSCACIIDAVKMAGGVPMLCDVNCDNLGLCFNSLQKIVTKTHVDMIIVPHMFGLPADIEQIGSLGIAIIEDCVHSPGAIYKGKIVGQFSELAVYSFEGTKMLPAGEGGAVMANKSFMVEQLEKAKNQQGSFHKHSRMSDLIASIAIIQINEHENIIRKRQKIALKYSKALSDLENKELIRLPKIYNGREHAYYRYIIKVSPIELNRLIEAADSEGIILRPPIATGPLSKTFCKKEESFPNSWAIQSSSLSIPIYPDLLDEEVSKIIHFLHRYEWREVYEPTKF